jgi:hypothetical protein
MAVLKILFMSTMLALASSDEERLGSYRLNEMTTKQLIELVKYNKRIIPKLEEQIGTPTDNQFTNLRKQIRILLLQIDNSCRIISNREGGKVAWICS